jgi:hypothetical protein
VGEDRQPVVVTNLVAALWEMDPVEWRSQKDREQYDRWFELLMGCKFVGIGLADFVEWSTQDPMYAGDAEIIATKWRSIEPRHGGAFWAALSARGIKVRQTNPAGQPSRPKSRPTQNWLRRLDSIQRTLERQPTADMLFWSACRVAETMIDIHKPVPSVARRLLKSSVGQAIDPEEIERIITNAFRHVEKQVLDREVKYERELYSNPRTRRPMDRP